MNNIYKVIWSKAKNCYVVASEIARSHTKSASGSEKIGGVARHALLALGAACAIACGGFVNVGAAVQSETISAGTTSNPVLTASDPDDDAQLTKVILAAREDKLVTKDNIGGQLTDYAKASDLSAKADANTVNDISTRVGTLETTVGNATSGLVEDVNEAKTDITTIKNTIGDDTAGLIKKVNDKANQSDLDAATGRITTAESEITKLETKTGNLSTDGKSLNGMNSVETGALKVTGEISDGTVNTTLAKIDASMKQTETNAKAIDALQTTTAGQADAIKDLKDRTTNISYDSGKRSTSINGIDIGDTQVDMNGKNLTDVGTINGIDLGTKQKGNYISQDGSIWGNMLEVDDQVKTNADNIETNKNAITALDAKVGTVGTGGTYLDSKKTISENLELLDAGLKQEVADRTAADIALSNRIGTVTDDGKYIKKSGTNNVSENLQVLDTQAKINADAIAKETADREAAIGELAVNGNYIKKDKNVSDNLVELDKQAKANADAITETNHRTAGITRDDTKKETSIEDKVTVDTNGNIKAEGTITSNGLDARAGEIKTTGKVSAGDVSTGTLETMGNAKIGGDLTVNGKLNVGEIYMEHKKQESTGEEYDSATSITADGISNNAKVTDRNGVKTESKFTHDKEGSTTYAYQGDAANWKKSTSNVTADGVENVAEDSKSNNNTFTQTSTDTKNTLTDKEGNTSTTRQDSKGIYGYAKDKDGNKSYTKQEGNRIAESVIGKDGKQTKSEMTSTNITNTAKDGTITNTAQNVTNEGTESVTNKVGNNEVKVSQNGVDITAEAGKKITESVGTASRVVENGKITDNAGDSTVTTENGKGTTFGKEGNTDTTNIYGDSIKTGTINAEDTTTDKLTAGAAAGADGGRLTVDANDGVKGSYKSGKYTSRSYILENTLKSGVDNDKDPTEDGFVGSRTDHYMVGDKAKLDETVKDDAGSNVTNKTSTDTVTTITDGTTTTKTEQGTKDITNTATAGTITNDAKVITNKASEVINNEAININNTATGTITSKASEIKNEADKLISNKVGENTWENMEDGKITTSIKNGTKQNLTQSDAEKTEHSVVNGSNSTVNKQTSEEITDAVTNGTTTNVTQNTATSSNNTIADKNGNANTVISTADGTSFINSKAAAPVTGASGDGTEVKTTIKGNTITTGKVTMDYAQVMRDLGVNGNANIDGKTTTGSLEVKGESKLTGKVTMESDATVGGKLDVTGKATFGDDVDITKNLSVGGDVTASSYKVGDKTYIDANGIHANGQKITDVADGSISEGSKDAVNGGQLYNVKNDLEGKVNKVGANAAAMANLHPMEFDPDSKWNIAAAIGNYGSETAAALGAFYRPNDDVMVNLSTAFGTGENMVGGGVSVRLGKGGNKLSREESNALKDQVNDLTARMDALLSVLNPNMSKDFPDVPENHWAYEAVSRLAGNDIVQGYPDGEFHGERTMTRYEMAEIIYNALSRGAEAEKELVEEFKPELQAMAASEKATAERAEG